MVARGSGTDGEVGKAGVRRVQRELYRGGTTVVLGAETVSTSVARHSCRGGSRRFSRWTHLGLEW